MSKVHLGPKDQTIPTLTTLDMVCYHFLLKSTLLLRRCGFFMAGLMVQHAPPSLSRTSGWSWIKEGYMELPQQFLHHLHHSEQPLSQLPCFPSSTLRQEQQDFRSLWTRVVPVWSSPVTILLIVIPIHNVYCDLQVIQTKWFPNLSLFLGRPRLMDLLFSLTICTKEPRAKNSHSLASSEAARSGAAR